MTKYEKAMNYLQIALNSAAQSSDDYGVSQSGYYEIGTAIEALKKQIPKKPDAKITNRGIDITGEYDIDSDYLCPTCKCVVGDCDTEDYWYNYCPNCGQAIDRGDSE